MRGRFLVSCVTSLVVVFVAVGSAPGQTIPEETINSPDNYPPPLPRREGPPPPRLNFETVEEIPLPGPLPERSLGFEDDQVRLAVAGGVAFIRLRPEPSIEIAPRSQDVQPVGIQEDGEDVWVLSDDGQYRYRATLDGTVDAERFRPDKNQWRNDWSYRVGGSVVSPPVIDGERLFFGSLDNQVHAVRADNGHRLWAEDVGGRVSLPLALWHGTLQPTAQDEAPREYALIIVVPDSGAEILALDAYDGSRIASLELPEHEGLVSPALVDPDGRIIVARKMYVATEAVLMVYRLGAPAPPTASGDQVAYNEPTPSPEGEPQNVPSPSGGSD